MDIIDRLEASKKEFKEASEQIVNAGSFQALTQDIKDTYSSYSTAFSRCVRMIIEGNSLSQITPLSNLFLIEYRLCLLMKAFRENLDSKIIKKMLTLNKKISSDLTEINHKLRSMTNEFNRIGRNLYQNWEKQLLKMDNYFDSIDDFNICENVFEGYKFFMKKIINLNENAITRNQDLMDFFEYYIFLYDIDSKFVVTFYKVLYAPKKDSKVFNEGILVIDVIFV